MSHGDLGGRDKEKTENEPESQADPNEEAASDDDVEEQSEQSFPASDPPSY